MRGGYPAIEELVPHAPPMLLLSQVLEHTPEQTRCRVDVARSALFQREDGRVPAWLGLEYLAQCVAAHGGLVARGLGEAPRPGLFLGTRRARFRARSFAPDETLEACVRHLRGELGLVAFDGRLERPGGGDALVEGRLSVYVALRLEELAAVPHLGGLA